jgi:hypothetical protein
MESEENKYNKETSKDNYPVKSILLALLIGAFLIALAFLL